MKNKVFKRNPIWILFLQTNATHHLRIRLALEVREGGEGQVSDDDTAEAADEQPLGREPPHDETGAKGSKHLWKDFEFSEEK